MTIGATGSTGVCAVTSSGDVTGQRALFAIQRWCSTQRDPPMSDMLRRDEGRVGATECSSITAAAYRALL